MRSRLWFRTARTFWKTSRPANAAANTASVVVPITRLVVRIHDPKSQGPKLVSEPARSTLRRLYGQSGRSERSMPRALGRVLGRAFGGLVVQDDQGVDRDAGLGIDQEGIDVNRGDPGARIRHQVGQANQRLHGGRLVQRRLAAIAL